MAGFADALKPEKFTGVHFKRWQVKVTLWLTAMNVFWVTEGKPQGELSSDQKKQFEDANTLFVGAILSVLGDRLCDVYMHITDAKELWDALTAKFGTTDAGSELYIMEQYHDYKMVDDRSVVEQAHEIQCIVRELELLKCVLPNQFVAGGIIAKLPPSWSNFATGLKHKRQQISVENLIASLDVEEKARAKDKHSRGGEGPSSANMVHKAKGKGKFKPSNTTAFKKKKKDPKEATCYVCGEVGHFALKCPQRKMPQKKADKKQPKDVNMVTGGTSEEGTPGPNGIPPC